MKRIKILLMDDSAPFARVTMEFLAENERLDVIGVACSCEEALERIRSDVPDLVLMDVNMPGGMSGIDLTAQIRASSDFPKIVVISLHDNQEYRVGALVAGADAFLAKQDFSTDLMPLIERLSASPPVGL